LQNGSNVLQRFDWPQGFDGLFTPASIAVDARFAGMQTAQPPWLHHLIQVTILYNIHQEIIKIYVTTFRIRPDLLFAAVVCFKSDKHLRRVP
jgi:hypothetical protein